MRPKKLHNEEIHNLYFSLNVTRMIRLRRVEGGACGIYGREFCAGGA
jgi:hypothetical protein